MNIVTLQRGQYVLKVSDHGIQMLKGTHTIALYPVDVAEAKRIIDVMVDRIARIAFEEGKRT